jgi:methionine-rich copper-binding protein CopC
MNSSFANKALRGALAASSIMVAQLAFAHAHPKAQTPAPDATVSMPHEVAIDYTEGLEPAFSTLVVIDAQGKQVNSAKSSVDTTDKKHMSVTLPELKPGAYQVEWTAVADDGHRTQGHYMFNVN